ncbi:MAG: hypothetical protein ACD_2C00130G0013 [uncultured bacterium (gcode 4)]|uniref:Uncharacterized protein n=1 Tax=uncultured bacterium (gcode 4) TaxID=1234023 RepID=K2G5Z6_9BACT|nr:MAG: hypothetical protein ACD_2C00130G0013 [uncultured bacterium (gcode 4)]
MKEKVKELLIQKQDSNSVARNMLEYIEYFTEQEISDIYILISDKELEQRKEILLRNLSEYENTIEEIVKIGLKFERLKTIMMYEAVKKQSKESLANLKSSLNLTPHTNN